MPPRTQLLRFTGSRRHDPAVDAWMTGQADPLAAIARLWFTVMRECGADVRELLHDGHPTACVADAGFAYVNVFKGHVNVGFFRGAEIPDPSGLLEGSGKHMRHVKVSPGGPVNAPALTQLIRTAHADMRARVEAESKHVQEAGVGAYFEREDRGNAPSPSSIDEYIETFPPTVQPLLRKVRSTIAKAAPGATEAIKYSLPAFVLNGNLVFFGGFSHHVGLYALPSYQRKFKAKLAPYKTGKGSVQFPYAEKLPIGLITEIVKFRVRENLERHGKKKAGKRGSKGR